MKAFCLNPKAAKLYLRAFCLNPKGAKLYLRAFWLNPKGAKLCFSNTNMKTNINLTTR